MLFLFFALGIPLTFIDCDAYVLLQVRRHDANHSNVDALIHKIVPGKFDTFVEKMKQKAAEEEGQNSRFNRARETEEEAADDGLALPAPQDKEPSFKDIITMVGRKFANSPSGPILRSKSKGYLFNPEPETVELDTGRSSVYSVQPDTVVVALKEILSSGTLKKYVDKLSRKAAVVYRTVENDIQPISSFQKFVKNYVNL